MSIQANRIHSNFIQHRDKLEHGYTAVPNYFLDNFVNRPFIGKDGKTHKISPTAALLYIAIRRYAFRHSSPKDNSYYESVPYPSTKTLAETIGVSERQCHRLLNELESAGLIARRCRPGYPNMLIIEPLPAQGDDMDVSLGMTSSTSTPDTDVIPRGDMDVTQRINHIRKHQKKTHTPQTSRVREIVYALTLATDTKQCARLQSAIKQWGEPAVNEAFERVRQELARPGCRIVDPVAILCKQAQTIAAASALREGRPARPEAEKSPDIPSVVRTAWEKLRKKEPGLDRSAARNKLCQLIEPHYPDSLKCWIREEIWAVTEHLPASLAENKIWDKIKVLAESMRPKTGEGGAVFCPSFG